MRKRKEKGVLCKLDIEKAYDCINWSFLLRLLRNMGFGWKWVRWIKWCITTASFFVIVNGSPTEFFNSSKGLRQGDPLSPYLFVLGMEVFLILVDKAAVEGLISGYKFMDRSGEEVQVTHLLFANDTLVFCWDTKEQMANVSWILLWFKAISRLNINLEKSTVLPVGHMEDLEGLSRELGCKIGSLPTSYLGLPLGERRNSTSVWDGVEARFRRKLAIWKRQYISKGGSSL